MRTERLTSYELRDGVAWLGLNRPDKRNAINKGLLVELEHGVRRAQDEAHALVIFGHGPCFQPAWTLRSIAREVRRRSITAPAHGTPHSHYSATVAFLRSRPFTERRLEAGLNSQRHATFV